MASTAQEAPGGKAPANIHSKPCDTLPMSKVVLITGSSSGIGLETAIRLARAGYRVFGTMRDLSRSEALVVAALEDKLPLDAVRLDVNDDASVAAGVAQVHDKAGRIDVLVNNAGVGGGGPFEVRPLEKGRATFETDYFGAIRMIRAVMPEMRARRDGVIVNVTSIAGLAPLPAMGHYAAAKHALEAATETLAHEARPFGVRVASVAPGVVLTPIFEKSSAPKFDREYPYAPPVRRLWRYFRAQLENPTLPAAVAEKIQHAIETDSPQLRYLVGRDAEILYAARQRTSAEEWIELSGIEDDEAYYDAAAELFGFDLFRRSANEV